MQSPWCCKLLCLVGLIGAVNAEDLVSLGAVAPKFDVAGKQVDTYDRITGQWADDVDSMYIVDFHWADDIILSPFYCNELVAYLLLVVGQFDKYDVSLDFLDSRFAGVEQIERVQVLRVEESNEPLWGEVDVEYDYAYDPRLETGRLQLQVVNPTESPWVGLDIVIWARLKCKQGVKPIFDSADNILAGRPLEARLTKVLDSSGLELDIDLYDTNDVEIVDVRSATCTGDLSRTIARALSPCVGTPANSPCTLFTCEPGFEPSPRGSVPVCTIYRTWSNLPACVPRTCPALEVAGSDSGVYSKLVFGDVAAVSCAGKRSCCVGPCNWDNPSPVCDRAPRCQCLPVDSPTCTMGWSNNPTCVGNPCAALSLDNEARSGQCAGTRSGSRCEFQCDSDHRLMGEAECRLENWVRPLPYCLNKNCNEAPAVANARASSLQACIGTKDGGRCAVACAVGYSLKPASSLSSSSSSGSTVSASDPALQCALGVWERLPFCAPDPCLGRNLPAIAFGNPTGCDRVESGSTCTITCLDSFAPSGPLMCEAGRFTNADTVACEPPFWLRKHVEFRALLPNVGPTTLPPRTWATATTTQLVQTLPRNGVQGDFDCRTGSAPVQLFTRLELKHAISSQLHLTLSLDTAVRGLSTGFAAPVTLNLFDDAFAPLSPARLNALGGAPQVTLLPSAAESLAVRATLTLHGVPRGSVFYLLATVHLECFTTPVMGSPFLRARLLRVWEGLAGSSTSLVDIRTPAQEVRLALPLPPRVTSFSGHEGVELVWPPPLFDDGLGQLRQNGGRFPYSLDPETGYVALPREFQVRLQAGVVDFGSIPASHVLMTKDGIFDIEYFLPADVDAVTVVVYLYRYAEGDERDGPAWSLLPDPVLSVDFGYEASTRGRHTVTVDPLGMVAKAAQAGRGGWVLPPLKEARWIAQEVAVWPRPLSMYLLELRTSSDAGSLIPDPGISRSVLLASNLYEPYSGQAVLPAQVPIGWILDRQVLSSQTLSLVFETDKPASDPSTGLQATATRSWTVPLRYGTGLYLAGRNRVEVDLRAEAGNGVFALGVIQRDEGQSLVPVVASPATHAPDQGDRLRIRLVKEGRDVVYRYPYVRDVLVAPASVDIEGPDDGPNSRIVPLGFRLEYALVERAVAGSVWVVLAFHSSPFVAGRATGAASVYDVAFRLVGRGEQSVVEASSTSAPSFDEIGSHSVQFPDDWQTFLGLRRPEWVSDVRINDRDAFIAVDGSTYDIRICYQKEVSGLRPASTTTNTSTNFLDARACSRPRSHTFRRSLQPFNTFSRVDQPSLGVARSVGVAGRTAAVAAPAQGMAYVLRRSHARSNKWTQAATLWHEPSGSGVGDGEGDPRWGTAVAVAGSHDNSESATVLPTDGETEAEEFVYVGCPGCVSGGRAGDDPFSVKRRGAVWVYRVNALCEAASPEAPESDCVYDVRILLKIDGARRYMTNFGNHVAASGDKVFVSWSPALCTEEEETSEAGCARAPNDVGGILVYQRFENGEHVLIQDLQPAQACANYPQDLSVAEGGRVLGVASGCGFASVFHLDEGGESGAGATYVESLPTTRDRYLSRYIAVDATRVVVAWEFDEARIGVGALARARWRVDVTTHTQSAVVGAGGNVGETSEITKRFFKGVPNTVRALDLHRVTGLCLHRDTIAVTQLGRFQLARETPTEGWLEVSSPELRGVVPNPTLVAANSWVKLGVFDNYGKSLGCSGDTYLVGLGGDGEAGKPQRRGPNDNTVITSQGAFHTIVDCGGTRAVAFSRPQQNGVQLASLDVSKSSVELWPRPTVNLGISLSRALVTRVGGRAKGEASGTLAYYRPWVFDEGGPRVSFVNAQGNVLEQCAGVLSRAFASDPDVGAQSLPIENMGLMAREDTRGCDEAWSLGLDFNEAIRPFNVFNAEGKSIHDQVSEDDGGTRCLRRVDSDAFYRTYQGFLHVWGLAVDRTALGPPPNLLRSIVDRSSILSFKLKFPKFITASSSRLVVVDQTLTFRFVVSRILITPDDHCVRMSVRLSTFTEFPLELKTLTLRAQPLSGGLISDGVITPFVNPDGEQTQVGCGDEHKVCQQEWVFMKATAACNASPVSGPIGIRPLETGAADTSVGGEAERSLRERQQCSFSGDYGVGAVLDCVRGVGSDSRCPLTSYMASGTFRLTTANHCPELVQEPLIEARMASFSDEQGRLPSDDFLVGEKVHLLFSLFSKDGFDARVLRAHVTQLELEYVLDNGFNPTRVLYAPLDPPTVSGPTSEGDLAFVFVVDWASQLSAEPKFDPSGKVPGQGDDFTGLMGYAEFIAADQLVSISQGAKVVKLRATIYLDYIDGRDQDGIPRSATVTAEDGVVVAAEKESTRMSSFLLPVLLQAEASDGWDLDTETAVKLAMTREIADALQMDEARIFVDILVVEPESQGGLPRLRMNVWLSRQSRASHSESAAKLQQELESHMADINEDDPAALYGRALQLASVFYRLLVEPSAAPSSATEPPTTIHATLTKRSYRLSLAVDFGTFSTTNFTKTLAAALDTDESRIDIRGIKAGSTIVDLDIYTDDSDALDAKMKNLALAGYPFTATPVVTVPPSRQPTPSPTKLKPAPSLPPVRVPTRSPTPPTPRTPAPTAFPTEPPTPAPSSTPTAPTAPTPLPTNVTNVTIPPSFPPSRGITRPSPDNVATQPPTVLRGLPPSPGLTSELQLVWWHYVIMAVGAILFVSACVGMYCCCCRDNEKQAGATPSTSTLAGVSGPIVGDPHKTNEARGARVSPAGVGHTRGRAMGLDMGKNTDSILDADAGAGFGGVSPLPGAHPDRGGFASPSRPYSRSAAQGPGGTTGANGRSYNVHISPNLSAPPQRGADHGYASPAAHLNYEDDEGSDSDVVYAHLDNTPQRSFGPGGDKVRFHM